jgi:hypothetical protein
MEAIKRFRRLSSFKQAKTIQNLLHRLWATILRKAKHESFPKEAKRDSVTAGTKGRAD